MSKLMNQEIQSPPLIKNLYIYIVMETVIVGRVRSTGACSLIKGKEVQHILRVWSFRLVVYCAGCPSR